MMDVLPQYTNRDYTVGWLCALARSELTAARMMLDRQHGDPVNLNTDDQNSYCFGEIHGHNVVITCMPPEDTGTLSAQKLVQPLKRSFPNMILHLFVGIGGGIPRSPPSRDSNKDIHLGDVVVGWAERAGVPAVVQYDHGRYNLDGNVELLSMLDKPNRRLLTALSPIISDREMGEMKFHNHLHRLRSLPKFQHPGLESDALFEADYDHVADESENLVEPIKPHCYQCNRAHFVDRPRRETTGPQFHQGTILSGNLVMRDARKRDELSKLHHDAICIEMEAAGVVEDTHCLVIRGIADYADSHKYWSWQYYAAATAAAFATELLHNIRPVVTATGKRGLNGVPPAPPSLKLDTNTLSSIKNQVEQHCRRPQREDITENSLTALACLQHADDILQKPGNDNPSWQLWVCFRLMTVEFDLSHDRRQTIEERIEHIRCAIDNGSIALRAASDSQQAAHEAQVRLELSFSKGRMVELEAQRGRMSAGEIEREKDGARRDMHDAIRELRTRDERKYREYSDRVSTWEERLRPKPVESW